MRTKGATNRSPRELKTAGTNLIKEAKLKERLARYKLAGRDKPIRAQVSTG